MSKFKPGDVVLVVSEHFEPDVLTASEATAIIWAADAPLFNTKIVKTPHSDYYWDFRNDDGSAKSDPSYDPGPGSIGVVAEVWPLIAHPDSGDKEGDPNNRHHRPNWYTVSVEFAHSLNGETVYMEEPHRYETYSFNDMELKLVPKETIRFISKFDL